jgi:Fic family protein
MSIDLKILTRQYLRAYSDFLGTSPEVLLQHLEQKNISVDHFQFYNAVSSVYSSKIEGEDIDFDSFFKHKFMNIKFKQDYTKKADDLYAAYEFIIKNKLNRENIISAHKILSNSLLPHDQQGFIRNNPMFVLNSNDEIEYVAAHPNHVKSELDKLFSDIETLIEAPLNFYEIFYFAAFIHLVFVKIHPFQDGNGRTARLIEKWFLFEKIGQAALSIPSEKHYYTNLKDYYYNIKKIGLEYETLNYNYCVSFLLMLPNSMRSEK